MVKCRLNIIEEDKDKLQKLFNIVTRKVCHLRVNNSKKKRKDLLNRDHQ